MELIAVIRGLEALKRPASVELVTDSMYVGKGLSEWLPKWKANGWRRREGKSLKEIKNEDLWRRLDELIGRHKIHFTHVRGHAATKKTNAATPWPWPRIRSICIRMNSG